VTGFLFVTGIYANVNVHPYVVLTSDVFLQLKLLFVLLAGINLFAFYLTGMSKAVDRLGAGEDAPPWPKCSLAPRSFSDRGHVFRALDSFGEVSTLTATRSQPEVSAGDPGVD
jgi:hypothetical protein